MARLKPFMPKRMKRNASQPTATRASIGSRSMKSRLSLFGATLCCAFGIGYVMQYGVPFAETRTNGPVIVDQITLTSSGAATPKMPTDLEALGLDGGVTLAAAEFGGMVQPLPPLLSDENYVAIEPDVSFDCDVSLQALPAAGAMVDLILLAPCNASDRVTIHHSGMMFTEVLQPDGTLGLTVPALTENAVFIASLPGGDGAAAATKVNSLPFYDRVVVQWKGEAGLQLHAREYDADYFTDGHVWAAKSGDLGNAARGEGGFLVRLGKEDAAEALIAEVYSFPTVTAKRSGEVQLSVEAEVTAGNCGKIVEAQTLDLRAGQNLRVHDLALDIPTCDATGDFLVLKNLVEDLTIASR